MVRYANGHVKIVRKGTILIVGFNDNDPAPHRTPLITRSLTSHILPCCSKHYLDFLNDLLEGESHTASNDHGIDLVQQVLDQLNLVRDLGTSQNSQEWLLGLLKNLGKELKLLLHQETGSTDREINANNGRVGTVGSTKGIVDVDITELGERLSELLDICFAGLGHIALLVLDLAFFLNVETQVLKENDLAILGISADRLDVLADAVIQKLDILLKEAGELLGDGGQAVLFNLVAIGATKMAHQDNRGSTYIVNMGRSDMSVRPKGAENENHMVSRIKPVLAFFWCQSNFKNWIIPWFKAY